MRVKRQALDAARAGAEQAAAMAQRTAHALESAIELLDPREAAAPQAAAALAGIDADALRAERRTLDKRRERLASLDQTWKALRTQRQRLAELDAPAQTTQAPRQGAGRARCRARRGHRAGRPVTQAERLLKTAQLACADGVESLRATLVDGDPCPVCGADGTPLPPPGRPAARGAGRTVRRTGRAPPRTARQREPAGWPARRVRRRRRKLAQLARERDGLAAALAQLDAEWDDSAGGGRAREAGTDARPGSPDRPRRCAPAYDGARARDRRPGRAELARDAAQQAWDQANAEHARLLEAAQNGPRPAGEAGCRHRRPGGPARCRGRTPGRPARANSTRCWPTPAATAGSASGSGPGRLARRPRAQAREWLEQSALQARLAAAASTPWRPNRPRWSSAWRRPCASATPRGPEFERIDADLRERREERAELFEGRKAVDVEQALGAAVNAARQAVAAARPPACRRPSWKPACAKPRPRLGRIADLQGELADAAARLAQWIEDFAGSDPGLEPVENEQQLASLLAVGAGRIAQERAPCWNWTAARARRARCWPNAARGAIDDGRDRAPARHRGALGQAVGADRFGRRQEIPQLRPAVHARRPARLRQQPPGPAGAALPAGARRKPAPLAGADGARPGHGRRIRSVNSLSGGESFLVSLALALGLASLSSNRVRVESLFIDEGFGSLDSDTLGVAMDALDALQSLGRKVGVISHVQEMTERIADQGAGAAGGRRGQQRGERGC
jgi:exonuclease SbcC